MHPPKSPGADSAVLVEAGAHPLPGPSPAEQERGVLTGSVLSAEAGPRSSFEC
jgi:hypothetical protein